jgi:hypothetical protein
MGARKRARDTAQRMNLGDMFDRTDAAHREARPVRMKINLPQLVAEAGAANADRQRLNQIAVLTQQVNALRIERDNEEAAKQAAEDEVDRLTTQATAVAAEFTAIRAILADGTKNEAQKIVDIQALLGP